MPGGGFTRRNSRADLADFGPDKAAEFLSFSIDAGQYFASAAATYVPAATQAGLSAINTAIPFGGAGNAATLAGGGGGAAAASAVSPWGLAIAGGMLLYSVLSRPNGKDRRSKGYAFQFRENPADPNDPIALVYGRPVFIPTVLFRYFTSEALNRTQPEAGLAQGVAVGLSLGGGPIDGGEIELWMNDQELFRRIDSTGSTTSRTLTPHRNDPTGTIYDFPADNIVPDSVRIDVDGSLYAVGGDNGIVEEADKQTFTGRPVTAKVIGSSGSTGDVDGDLTATSGVLGGVLPVDGVVRPEDLSVTVSMKNLGVFQTVSFDGGATFVGGKQFSVPPSAIHVGELDDGRSYFWIASHNDKLRTLFGQGFVTGFTVSGKYARTVEITTRDGQWVAVFTDDLSASTVTATYDASILGDDIGYEFRPGTIDNQPARVGAKPILPTDGTRNVRTIGTELTQASDVTFTSSQEVNDIEIILESGPEGFTDPANVGRDAGDFRPANRKVSIKVREDGAADVLVEGTDPSKGWVTLNTGWQPGPGKTGQIFELIQNTRGTARWIFSIADLLHFKRSGKATKGNSLPKRAKYQVKVTAINVAGARAHDDNQDAGVVSDLFFASAQEVQRVSLRLPYHATLTIFINNLERVSSEPVFAVGTRGRKVWVPESTAAYSSATLRPEPGGFQWSRNPEWCGCDLVTNRIFGGGEHFDWQRVNLAASIAAAAFNDATESYGARAELDTVIQHRAKLWDHRAQISAGARCLPTLDGGTWRTVIDQDGDAVLALDEDDFERGTLRKIEASLEEIPTEMEAAFTSEETDFELDTAGPRHVEGTNPSRRVNRRIDLTGVRRREQADRVLDLTLAQFTTNTHSIEGRGAGWQLMRLQSGDIVSLTSAEVGAAGEKYRVEVLGIPSTFRCPVRLTRNDPGAYGAGFRGANSRIEPGLRPPSMGDTTTSGIPPRGRPGVSYAPQSVVTATEAEPSKLSVKRVKGSGSAFYEVDVGSLPVGARSVVCRWGRKGAPKASAGEHGTSPFRITVPNVGALEIEVYLRTADGTRGPSRFESINTHTDQVTERVGIADAEVTTAVIAAKQEGGTLTVTPSQPAGTEAQEVEYEVRVSEPEESEDEALLVGTTRAGVPLQVNTWPVDNMRVHVRPRYADTGDPGIWATEDVDHHTTPEGLVVVTDDAGTSFGSWTIATLYGYTPLEDSSGLQNVAVPPIWNTTNTNSIWGMSGDVPIWSLRDYFPYGLITAPAASLSGAHDFLPGMFPQFSANTKTSRSIWGMTGFPPLNPPVEDADGTGDFRENHLERRRRWRDHCMWNTSDWDRTPVEIKQEVSTNGGADWAEVQPGRRYRSSMKQSRFHIYCRGGTKRVKLTTLQDFRWVWNKKWEYKVPLSGNTTGSAFAYTFAPVPIIEGTPVASVSVVDESLDANTSYVTTITSLTATAIAVTIHDIDTSTPSFGVPTQTDTYLNIVLTGY